MSTQSHTLGKSVFGSEKLKVANLFNVEGWVCVVTGGGTGLGLTTAAALAQNGARVYITGRRGDVLDEAVKQAAPMSGNGSLHAIQGDASTKEGIAKLRDSVASKESHVNLLVNNHGVSLSHPNIEEAEQTPEGLSSKMFEEETMEHWIDAYTINCASYYFTSFAFLPLLSKAKTVGNAAEPGNIINIASLSGITKTSQRGQFSYNAGKAGTISLSHQLATEFARRGLGVRVNCVCPGYFPSGMTPVTPEVSEASRKDFGIPFGRAGNAIDYAQMMLGLAVNQYQTGSDTNENHPPIPTYDVAVGRGRGRADST